MQPNFGALPYANVADKDDEEHRAEKSKKERILFFVEIGGIAFGGLLTLALLITILF